MLRGADLAGQGVDAGQQRVAVDGPKLKRCGLFFRQSFKVVPEQVAMSPVRSLLLGLRDEVDDNYKSKTWWTRTTTTAGTP